MNTPKLYRPCVGIALFNVDGLVFVGERIDTPGAWQMPQGGIDPGENIEKAAKRELQEEIGTDNVEILKIIDEKIRYDLPDNMKKKLWDGVYVGQEQTWVAVRFLGDDNEIDITAYHPPEFRSWQWIELEKTVDIVVPFKQETYRQVISWLSKM